MYTAASTSATTVQLETRTAGILSARGRYLFCFLAAA